MTKNRTQKTGPPPSGQTRLLWRISGLRGGWVTEGKYMMTQVPPNIKNNSTLAGKREKKGQFEGLEKTCVPGAEGRYTWMFHGHNPKRWATLGVGGKPGKRKGNRIDQTDAREENKWARIVTQPEILPGAALDEKGNVN